MLNTIKEWLEKNYNGGICTTYGEWDLEISNEDGNILVVLSDWKNRREAISVIAGRRILEMDKEIELEQYINTILYYNTNDMEEEDD